MPSAPVVAGGRGGAGPRHPLAQNLGPATLFITRFGQIVVCNNNNNCCVELRGATAGAAELRGAAGSGGLYGRSRLAYVRKVRTLRETARARARAGRVGGTLATRVFRLEPTRELGRGLLMHGARLLPLCYRPRMMMRCHTDESLNLVLAGVEWSVINHELESNCYSVCNEIYFGLQPAKFGSCNLFITKFGQLCYATTTTVVLSRAATPLGRPSCAARPAVAVFWKIAPRLT